MVTRKREYKDVDGTPQKRVFLSIINDYNLRTGLCELVDNAIDMWLVGNRKKRLVVDVILDSDRQMISVSDNAGGVKEDEFEYLISPGATSHQPQNDTIGVFGVGGKRAGVALGELVEIKSRHKNQKSLQIDITKEWLATDDWTISVYEIPNVRQSTTIVEITKLRQRFDDDDINEIREHLGATYGHFLSLDCEINLNGSPVEARFFDTWAYPPDFPPRRLEFDTAPVEDENLKVKITAGLIIDREPEQENYGVYFYCNNRLIVKEVRTREVGYFVASEAGVPHPDASLCRVIVDITGNPSYMPWNSSKSDLNFSHPVFLELRPSLIDLVSFFSKLSRRLKMDWMNQVFRHKSGDVELITSTEIKASGKLIHPELPRARSRPYFDELKEKNKKLLSDQPWTLGLLETLGIVDVIAKQKLDTKNRSALVLLDSNLEIAFKEFIVNRDDLFPRRQYPDPKIQHIFQSRQTVINEVCAHVKLTKTQLSKISHYYGLRNKLIHERASVGITERQVDDYRHIVEQVLSQLFGAKFPKRSQ